MREVRLALLEADVNFKVVKEFVARVRERAVGAEILESLTAGQQVVKIVHEELTALLSAGDRTFRLSGNPAVVTLVGLQGSGKTTSAAKLAKHVAKLGRQPMLVAADPYRPAAADQLETLGNVARHRRPSRAGRHADRRHRPRRHRGREAPGPRRRDHRHRRPPHHRRRADGRDPRDQRRREARRDAAGRGRDDRPGGRHRRPGVRRGRPGDRPRADQDRRRRPRRRGPARSAPSPASRSSSWAPARRPTRSRCSIPTASPAGSWAWATSSRSPSAPRRPSTRSRPPSSRSRCARARSPSRTCWRPCARCRRWARWARSCR